MDSRLRTRIVNHRMSAVNIDVAALCPDEDMEERQPSSGLSARLLAAARPKSLFGESADRLRCTMNLLPSLLLPNCRAAGLENKMHSCHLDCSWLGRVVGVTSGDN